MKKEYPWVDFYMKTVEEKGHRKSMNIIYSLLCKLKCTYWIHMEDDFLFFHKDHYITKSIDFLNESKDLQVKQVVFNRGYGETIDSYNTKSYLPINFTKEFVLHDHKIGNFNYRNNHYWPYYTLNPSLVDTSAIFALGNYDSPNTFFERDYADKWNNAGYKTAFFNRINCKHIGRLLCEKNKPNAYDLNNESQFNSSNMNQTQNIFNLVLTNEDEYYNQMYQITREYYKSVPNTKTYYFQFSEKITTDYELRDDLLLIKGTESIVGTTDKTVKAFQYFKDQITKYKYLIRSSVSTIVNLGLLTNSLANKPVEYGGHFLYTQLHSDEKYNNIKYFEGTSIIFSRKTFNLIMGNVDSIDYSVVDDLSFGLLMSKLNIKPTIVNGRYCPNESKEELLKAIESSPVFYRNKNVNDRNIDIQNMKLIITEIKIKN
jgi:hypothetical protein